MMGEKHLHQFMINVQKFLMVLYSQIIGYAMVEKNKQLILESTKSAIAAVISRNMSHNIGSHVLSRLVEEKSVENIAKNETSVVKLEVKSGENPLDIKQIFLYDENKQRSYYELSSRFHSYLKTRMDLLADIITGIPQVQNSNFILS